MKQGTLKIAKKYIINEGSADEQWYDDITKRQLDSEHRIVYVVRKNKKCGILDESGRIITPLIYDDIMHFSKHFSGKYFYVKRGGKAGFITSDNQIIFPFIYDKISIDYMMGLAAEKVSMVSFFDTTAKKFGLARWSSGELIQEAQWDYIKFVPGTSYFECGEGYRDNQHEEPYYLLNIVDDNGKKLFDSCKYILFLDFFGLEKDYNVAVTKFTAYNPILGYTGLNFEIFYKDGTIAYSDKCHRIQRVDYYDNAFVIESPGRYDSSDDFSLHVYYQDKQGNHVLYVQNFKCRVEIGSSPHTYAQNMLKRDPKFQEMIKAR